MDPSTWSVDGTCTRIAVLPPRRCRLVAPVLTTHCAGRREEGSTDGACDGQAERLLVPEHTRVLEREREAVTALLRPCWRGIRMPVYFEYPLQSDVLAGTSGEMGTVSTLLGAMQYSGYAIWPLCRSLPAVNARVLNGEGTREYALRPCRY